MYAPFFYLPSHKALIKRSVTVRTGQVIIYSLWASGRHQHPPLCLSVCMSIRSSIHPSIRLIDNLNLKFLVHHGTSLAICFSDMADPKKKQKRVYCKLIKKSWTISIQIQICKNGNTDDYLCTCTVSWNRIDTKNFFWKKTPIFIWHWFFFGYLTMHSSMNICHT